ncbi:MAG: winged helix-turn-helix domain-containing protein [Alphaproteobacteria bacterium]|nr:winged helix-turn-helix domain-containing protein [Alphaproteobacteria bacterium]
MRQWILGSRTIYPARQICVGTAGPVGLTPTEVALLTYLLEADGRAVPREELLREVWGYHARVKSRTVDTTLNRLRIKVEDDPQTPVFLETLRGEGIRLVGVSVVDALPAPRPVFVGRDGSVREVREALAIGRVVTLTGPVAAGKSRIAVEVLGAAAIVDTSACRTAHDLLVQTVRALELPASTAPTVGAVAEALVGRSVVFDGADGLEPDAVAAIERFAAVATVLVTAREALGLPVEWVQRVPVLSPEAAAELLASHLRRLGSGDDPELVAAVVARIDRLPGEIELLAPAVASFGVAAAEGGAEPLQGALAKSIALLGPAEHELLVQLTVFRDRFELHGAAAVTGRSVPSAMRGLLELQRRNLVIPDGGGFRVLRNARATLEVPDMPHTRARLRAWCCALQDRSLVDGPATLALYVPDLLAELPAATPDEALAIAAALLDHAILAGPFAALLPVLRAVPHADPWWGAAAALLAYGSSQHPLDAERRAMATLEAQGHLLALSAPDALLTRPVADPARCLANRPMTEQARFAAVFLERRVDPVTYAEAVAPIEVEAARQGWHYALAHLRLQEMSVLVRSGRWRDVTLRDDWPASDGLVGGQAALWLGLAWALDGDIEAALAATARAARRHPNLRPAAAVHLGALRLLQGDREQASREVRDGLRGASPFTRKLGLALLELLGEVDGQVDDPLVRALLDGPATELDPRKGWLVLIQLARAAVRGSPRGR